MFDKFKKVGELKKLRDQAVALKKVLVAEIVTVEESGVRVVISGDQKFKEVSINGEVNKALINALNKAIKKSQKVAAKKLQSLGGGLGGFGL